MSHWISLRELNTVGGWRDGMLLAPVADGIAVIAGRFACPWETTKKILVPRILSFSNW